MRWYGCFMVMVRIDMVLLFGVTMLEVCVQFEMWKKGYMRVVVVMRVEVQVVLIVMFSVGCEYASFGHWVFVMFFIINIGYVHVEGVVVVVSVFDGAVF